MEFSAAQYHVTARGDRQEWLRVLGEVCTRFNRVIHANGQMSNHYHIVIETLGGNLSRGMRQLNGLYTQRFNRRYGLAGHLLQGRYKAIPVQKESYLLELARYVVLNPVRAGMLKRPEEWPWSRFQVTVSKRQAVSEWLDVDGLLSSFDQHRRDAVMAYTRFVLNGIGGKNPLKELKHQLFLGDDSFVGPMQRDSKRHKALRAFSKAHRRALAKPLSDYASEYSTRNEAMARAYLSGAYTMQQIGKFFGVHTITVSRAVRQFEQERMLEC